MTIFDAYLIVDWSANNTPKRGADSIWYALLRRTRRGLRRTALANPATRAEAFEAIRALLRRLAADDQRVLAGFDFPNGYPRGFARAAGFRGKPWRAVWDGLADLVEDGADNTNNRFEVAAELNRRASGKAFPFWACPPGRSGPHLSATKVREYADDGIPERRLCERYVPSTQPCWKLFTTGSVGGQALVGIPVQRALRDDPDLAAVTRVWPFETGLEAPTRKDGWRALLAEVYPSLVPVRPGPGEIKDALQVDATARFFAARDEDGTLARDLAGPEELTREERQLVEAEEGWLLGAGTVTAPLRPAGLDYLREPAEIYRRSFATIRREADLSGMPRGVADVAVRLIHACGMTDIAQELSFSTDVVRKARRAMRAGAPVLCDVRMVAEGVIADRLPVGNRVLCTLNDRRVPDRAKVEKTTRSAAAVGLWGRRLDGAVVAIGNAPTALFRLLELLQAGAPRPAAILAFPVGFVGAAESKQALIDAGLDVPYLTLPGRRGGSAMAAAAVNAIAGARR